MSRLLVKNLPSYVTPAHLQEHFQQKGCPAGTLTDFKVALKPDGTSRRFGFVGYKTEKEAASAKEWFDKTFIGSSRISVGIIEGAKDAPSPRPNKRPRLGPSPTDGDALNNPKTPLVDDKAITAATKTKSEPHLDKFMEVMQPRTKKGPVWANEIPSKPIIESEAHPKADDDSRLPEDAEPRDDPISDLDWMKRRMTSTVDVEEKVFEQSDEEGPPAKAHDKQPPPEVDSPKDATADTLLKTARLFIRNLAFACTDSDLVDFFKPYGEISQVHIPTDLATRQCKGIAFVTFKKATDAVSAYEALDRKSFQGRLIHILAAVNQRPDGHPEDAGERKGTVKKQKQTQRKAAAGKEFNWSMLYMNSDAVASSIADRLGIDKASILNPESGENAAVKLALAETHIIQETKTYLESQGVLLSSFGSPRRSDTTILVKNIPYGTTSDQIREMFQPHGELIKVLVPPAGTMAVVEFDKPDEAAKAFRAVAYRRLGNSIIYLEKGPLGMFVEGDAPGPSTQLPPPTSTSNGDTEHAPDEAEQPSITGGSTLYVKNLSFSTTQERFTKMFQHLPSFSFARIQTKPDPKRPNGPRLSMGYGFIGFKDIEGAKKALTSLQGFLLDGHQLTVKFAGRGAEEDTKAAAITNSNSQTTKMIVKNVPFEATKKDIRALFGTHGHLKSVRLPKRFDSRTRGFAFLDFVSRAEAENAYATLRHTHLLGRHLVLEWAEEAEQDIEVLRKKAGVGYGDGKLMPGQKRKLDLGTTGEDNVDDLEV